MDVAGMQNARLGVIYLWQGTDVKSPIVSTVLGGLLGSTGGILGAKDINFPVPDQVGDLATHGVEAGLESTATGTLWERIKAWAADFVKRVWAEARKTLGDVAAIAGHLKNITLFITQQVFTKAAPVIGSVAGLVTGLWKTTVAFCEKFATWRASYGVRLNFGHPKTLVKGVETGLTRSIFEGLYEVARSAVSVGLNAAGLGAGAIFDAVVACVEAAAKLVWRIGEYFVMKKFTDDAKVFWSSRGTATAMHLSSMKFDNWLRPATEKVPVLAAVTLGSGIAGDKMRFLQMYTGDGGTITESQFADGVTYLDKLKRMGSRLIERSGIEFTSTDAMIDGLLKLAERHDEVHAKKRGFFARLFRTADKVVRA